MKNNLLKLLSAAICLMSVQECSSQSGSSAEAKVTERERGPHHRVWERITVETNTVGQVSAQTNSYTELETSMHRWANGQWVESSADIQLTVDGAAATNAAHQVLFAANVNTAPSIVLITPEGKRLSSRIFGLSYFDAATGKAVLLAETKDSIGLLLGSNRLVYTNAFDDVAAEIEYFVTKAGLEQNVVLQGKLPDPSQFDLDPASTRLQVLTEFFDPPTPVKAAGLQTTGFVDEALDFGEMKIPRLGKAFSVGEDGEIGEPMAVSKQWTVLEGRTFLVEEMPFNAVEEKIQAFVRKPRTASVSPRLQGKGENVIAALNNVLPRRGEKKTANPKRMAKLEQPLNSQLSTFNSSKTLNSRKTFVLDYTILTSQTNFTFRGDTTYYISGTVNLSGTNTTFEGGTVIKYAPTNTAKISITSPITWQGNTYRPVIMTARDDSTVGESITTTNALTGYYADIALDYDSDSGDGGNATLQHLRIAYAKTAISIFKSTHVISHAQFVNCQRALYGTGSAVISLRNALMQNVLTNFAGSTFKGEQLTIDTANWLNAGATIALTNCLLVNVTNTSSFTSNSVSTVTSRDFQTVGAGSHYLADNSAYRNAGTTNINTDLRTALKKQTTYPPIVLSNIVVSSDTTLVPQAQRDTDIPDLGYHYDPVDYLVDTCIITNAILGLSNGVVVACDNAPTGFWLENGSTIDSLGSPVAPNWVVHYTFAQEQSVLLGGSLDSGGIGINSYHEGSPAPRGVYRFTRFVAPKSRYSIYHNSSWAYTNLVIQDGEFWNGDNNFGGSGGSVATVKNNLFHYSSLYASASATTTLTFSNNLVWDTSATFLNLDTSNLWRFHDNAFDASTVSSSFKPLTNSHNAYINGTGRLNPTNANDVVLTNFTYASGSLGDFYHYTTNLVNKGSQTADLVGLYHYTTTTNQVKETNSVVDIGYHYVATDGSGIPIDTDGDGVPDYWEDTNGNGNGGDDATSWQNYNSPNGLVSGSGLQVFRPLQ